MSLEANLGSKLCISPSSHGSSYEVSKQIKTILPSASILLAAGWLAG
jgi:hypothetical protein